MKTKQELEKQLSSLNDFEGLYEKFMLPMASESLRVGCIITLKWVLGHEDHKGSGISPSEIITNDLKNLTKT